MSEDEERMSVLAAKQQLQGSLRHFDSIRPVAGRIVHENVARRDIDIPLCIRRYTLSALLGEKLQGGYRAVVAHLGLVRLLLGFIGHVERLARMYGRHTERP